MKNQKTTHWMGLALTLGALAQCVAMAQTNTLPATYVYPLSAANLSKPGFIWNVSQVAAANPGSLPWAESELEGGEGPNLADPSQVYSSASGSATVPGNPDLPITFSIPGSINFSIANPDCGHNRQDLPCEDGMVGTPGSPPDAGNGTDNIVGEALTYLALPKGLVTMGVRSDDGFQLQMGAAVPGDRYSTNAIVVESYPGTRSAGDNIVTFNVAQAGLYAARLLYYDAGGDASVEWYTFPPAGTTNASLGGLNTGTNAVLVNDVADGGIAAYQAITSAPLSSYLSSLSPAPGASGLPIYPSFAATLVNGSVPVTGVTLSIDGTAVPATVTTTGQGANISYTVTNLLANIPTHTLVVSWNDNGTIRSVSSSFSTESYVLLDPSTVVTPDTTKPGFRFNIFANSSDSLISTQLGVQGGESDFLDNADLGLNGLDPDGLGGVLPNEVNLASANVAVGPAPALGGPNAPAEFIITNTIDMTGNNMPGFPPQDGSDPSHSELLTYVHLPAGLTTFTLNLDGYYRAYMGSWDYVKESQVGHLNTAVTASDSGSTSFSVFVTQAGYYPLRIATLNLDGTPQFSLYTTDSGGKNVLVNDIANGGFPAYYALATPTKPYVRYTSPRPVMFQMERPSDHILLRIQDADTKVSDSTVAFNLDGRNVNVTKNRVGDVLELTWTTTNLQTPTEIHTGSLTFQDTGGSTITDTWQFMNLKAIWIPTAAPGTFQPTGAAVLEDFSEYADPSTPTNDGPTGPFWYKSPQPENPLVDIAPIWSNTPAGPTGWYVWNFDAPGNPGYNTSDANSFAYANFICEDLGQFPEGDTGNIAPGEEINGVPLTQLIAPGQNVFIAESDNRSGSSPGQTQFGISKRFDLSNVANPVLVWANIKKQNQDDFAGLEYSPDGGVTWAPIFYSFDGHAQGSDAPDLQVAANGVVDVNNTLFHDTNPGEVPTWPDATGDVNNTFASGLAAPISQNIGIFFAPRINDDKFEGKRIEAVRLPLAAHQSDVRLRICQIGTCSWYYGVGDLAFYDIAPAPGVIVPTGLPSVSVTTPVLSISTGTGKVTITWTGSGTLQSATALTGKPGDWSNVTPAPSGNTYTANIGAGDLFFRVVSQ